MMFQKQPQVVSWRCSFWVPILVSSLHLVSRLMVVSLCFVVVGQTTLAAGPGDLAKAIEPLVKAHDGTVGVSVEHLPSGEKFTWNADQPMPTASLIKLPVLAAMHHAIAEGKIGLDDWIELKDSDMVPGSGVITGNFSAGTKLKLRDAARLMIVFSDNTATNLVVDKIGLPATAKLMESYKFPNTKLHAKVFRRDTSIFPERSKQFGLGSTTANEMVGLLKMIASGQLIDANASKQIIELLRDCDDRTKIPRDLPAKVKVAHKTGAVSNSRTDAGIIEAPSGQIAICVLTTENGDRGWNNDNAANVLIGKIAKAAFDHFNPDGIEEEDDSGKLAMGADGELVEALQRTLNARLRPSPGLGVDGDFGPATQAAVKRFQESVGLPTNGIVDEAMWKKLGKLLTEPASVEAPDIVNSEAIEIGPELSIDGPPEVTCKGWVIADGASGEVLWGRDAEKRLHPASTTKIMTGYLVAKLAEADPKVWDEVVTFSKNADKTIGSTTGLKAGEQVPVSELLYGLLLPSGNDASVALAEHFGDRVMGGNSKPNSDGNFDEFVAGMNQAARELGLTQTHYTNTHGLTHEDHLTCARDLAVLAFHAMKLPEFQKRTSTVQRGCTVRSLAGYERNVKWKNTNRLLRTEGFDGVKTGTTSAAGACLVTRSTRDEQRLIVVVLGSANSDARYVDTRNLHRWAWSQVEQVVPN